MFSKSNVISTFATTIWGFFGGYLLWGILADPFLMDHLGAANVTVQEMPDMSYLVLGCLLTGLFFSTIFSKWSGGNYSAIHGAQYGILIGLFVGFGGGIIDFSTTAVFDITGTMVNGIVYVVHFMIMGVLASIVYKKTSS